MDNKTNLLPQAALTSLNRQTDFLFTITLEFDIHILGDTPYGVRRIAGLTAGSFEGPNLKGTVLRRVVDQPGRCRELLHRPVTSVLLDRRGHLGHGGCHADLPNGGLRAVEVLAAGRAYVDLQQRRFGLLGESDEPLAVVLENSPSVRQGAAFRRPIEIRSKNSSSGSVPGALMRISSSYAPDAIALSKIDGLEVSPVTEYSSM